MVSSWKQCLYLYTRRVYCYECVYYDTYLFDECQQRVLVVDVAVLVHLDIRR